MAEALYRCCGRGHAVLKLQRRIDVTMRSQACLRVLVVLAIGLAFAHTPAFAQAASGKASEVTKPDPPGEHDAENADVSRQLANPIANMVSVPFQFNWAGPIAPFDSTGFDLNFQPVVPFTLNDDWNLILRFILPFVGAPALTT